MCWCVCGFNQIRNELDISENMATPCFNYLASVSICTLIDVNKIIVMTSLFRLRKTYIICLTLVDNPCQTNVTLQWPEHS